MKIYTGAPKPRSALDAVLCPVFILRIRGPAPVRANVMQHRAVMNTRSRSFRSTRRVAFSVMELFITVACLVLLAAVLLPALAKSKSRSSRINCNNNAKQIGLSFRTWSFDNHDHFPMQVSCGEGGTMEVAAHGEAYPHFQVLSNELSTPKVLLCPMDEKRSYSTSFASFADTNLSYFVNINARNGDNGSLLLGDRNLTNRARASNRLVALAKVDSIAWTRELHSEKGNLGFGDGSVRSFRNGSVGTIVKSLDGTTNWLAVP